MTRLSININKVALIRNARGGNMPNLLQVAQDLERFGSQGITVHPRPDERHIRYQDCYDLKEIVTTELNIEGYPTERFLKMVSEVRPEQCTLVPDPPEVLTSDAGWDTIKHQALLKDIVAQLHAYGCRVSLFIEPVEAMLEAAKMTGTDCIELYTGPYAAEYSTDKEKAILLYRKASQFCQEIGLGVNAGHDLNLENLRFFKEQILDLQEVSIGHALISDALYYGLENTTQLYKRLLT